MCLWKVDNKFALRTVDAATSSMLLRLDGLLPETTIPAVRTTMQTRPGGLNLNAQDPTH